MRPPRAFGIVLLASATGCGRPTSTPVPAPLVAQGSVPVLAYAVTEITQSESPGYAVTLRRDGTAEYRGECCVPMLGLYRAHIDSATFISLAAYLLRRNVAELRGDYYPTLEESDASTTVTTLVMAGDTVVISREDHCGPPVLAQIEGAVEVVVDWLRWTKSR